MGRKDPFRWSVGLHRRPILDFQTVPRDCQILDTRQPPDHQSAHGGVDERFAGGTQPLVVLLLMRRFCPNQAKVRSTTQLKRR
jgi:hypothetical protein